MEVNKIIEAAAKSAASETVLLLKAENLLKNKRNAFQKTEVLLYNYKKFKNIISEKDKQIKSIKQDGLPRKSKSITSWGGNTNMEPESDMEKLETKIAEIEKSIIVTRRLIKITDNALTEIAHDQYYPIIERFYFDNSPWEEVTVACKCDKATMYRNKRRLVDKLKIILFSSDVITEIFYS